MSRELEIIGLGAASELAGPAPERPGDGPKHAAAHTECLNCGATLHGRFCHACGQTADDHHRSIFHLMWEAVEGLTHLDGRLAKTLPPLFFRPGALARDHFEGRRQRHVPPFRLFLVALLLFMLALEVVVHGAGRHGAAGEGAAHGAKPSGPHVTIAPLTPEQSRRLGVDLPAAPAKDLRIESALLNAQQVTAQRLGGAQVTKDMAAARDAKPELPLPAAPAAPQIDPGMRAVLATDAADEAAYQRAAELAPTDGGAALAALSGTEVASNPLAKWFMDRAKAAGVNPELFISTMFAWAHRLAVLLLPVFALLLLACYFYKRRFYVYDHLVVSMQLLSFVFLISAAAWILPEPVRGVAIFAAILWTPVNLFMTLRGAYGSSVIGAVVKTFFLWTSAMVVFGVLMLGIVVAALSQM